MTLIAGVRNNMRDIGHQVHMTRDRNVDYGGGEFAWMIK